MCHAPNSRMKELELEDRQYEIDKELAELANVSRKTWGEGVTHCSII